MPRNNCQITQFLSDIQHKNAVTPANVHRERTPCTYIHKNAHAHSFTHHTHKRRNQSGRTSEHSCVCMHTNTHPSKTRASIHTRTRKHTRIHACTQTRKYIKIIHELAQAYAYTQSIFKYIFLILYLTTLIIVYTSWMVLK